MEYVPGNWRINLASKPCLGHLLGLFLLLEKGSRETSSSLFLSVLLQSRIYFNLYKRIQKEACNSLPLKFITSGFVPWLYRTMVERRIVSPFQKSPLFPLLPNHPKSFFSAVQWSQIELFWNVNAILLQHKERGSVVQGMLFPCRDKTVKTTNATDLYLKKPYSGSVVNWTKELCKCRCREMKGNACRIAWNPFRQSHCVPHRQRQETWGKGRGGRDIYSSHFCQAPPTGRGEKSLLWYDSSTMECRLPWKLFQGLLVQEMPWPFWP